MSKRRPGRARAVAALACLVGVLAITACGGDEAADESTKPSSNATAAESTAVDEARQRVEAASGPVEFKLTEPVPDVAKADGKRVFFLANLISVPFVQYQLEALREAMGEVGVKVDTGASNGNVAEAERLLKSAVNQEYDAVIVNSIPSKLLSNALKEAKAAGVPIIQQFEADPRAPTEEDAAHSVFGHVTFDYSETGRLMADYVIADSGGKATAAAIGSSDAITSGLQTEAMEKQFAEACPDCSFKVSDVLIGDWATRMGPVAATIVRDPNVNYLMPVWDGMSTFVLPEIKKANAQDRIKVVTSNGDVAQMKMLANGDLIAADVGDPLDWAGWATADQTLRALVGAAPVADELIPLRLFGEHNIGEIDVNGPPEAWYGDVDIRSEYRKLWGI